MVHRGASDSRLLSNLLSHEREYSKQLTALLTSSSSSLSSFTAYAAAAPPTTSRAILNIAAIVSAADDALAGYGRAVEEWRDLLRGLNQLEEEVTNIIRDREILVTRLIKASNKSSSNPRPSSSNLRRFSASSSSLNLQNQSPFRSIPTSTKLAAAQSELQACETHLDTKEQELAQRRVQVIRDGFTLRGRAMVELGWSWSDLGRETIAVVEQELGVTSKPGLNTPLPQHSRTSSEVNSIPYPHRQGHPHIPGSFDTLDSSDSSNLHRRNSMHIPAAHAIHCEDMPIPLMSTGPSIHEERRFASDSPQLDLSRNSSYRESVSSQRPMRSGLQQDVREERRRSASASPLLDLPRNPTYSGAGFPLRQPVFTGHLSPPPGEKRASWTSQTSDEQEIWADASDGEHHPGATAMPVPHAHLNRPLERQLSDIRESPNHMSDTRRPNLGSPPLPIVSTSGVSSAFGGFTSQDSPFALNLPFSSPTGHTPSSRSYSTTATAVPLSIPTAPLSVPTAPGSVFSSREYKGFREASMSSSNAPQGNAEFPSHSSTTPSGVAPPVPSTLALLGAPVGGEPQKQGRPASGTITPGSSSEGEVYTGTRVRMAALAANEQPLQSQTGAGTQRGEKAEGGPAAPKHTKATRRSSIAVVTDPEGVTKEIHVHEGVQVGSEGHPLEYQFESAHARVYEGAIVSAPSGLVEEEGERLSPPGLMVADSPVQEQGEASAGSPLQAPVTESPKPSLSKTQREKSKRAAKEEKAINPPQDEVDEESRGLDREEVRDEDMKAGGVVEGGQTEGGSGGAEGGPITVGPVQEVHSAGDATLGVVSTSATSGVPAPVVNGAQFVPPSTTTRASATRGGSKDYGKMFLTGLGAPVGPLSSNGDAQAQGAIAKTQQPEIAKSPADTGIAQERVQAASAVPLVVGTTDSTTSAIAEAEAHAPPPIPISTPVPSTVKPQEERRTSIFGRLFGRGTSGTSKRPPGVVAEAKPADFREEDAAGSTRSIDIPPPILQDVGTEKPISPVGDSVLREHLEPSVVAAPVYEAPAPLGDARLPAPIETIALHAVKSGHPPATAVQVHEVHEVVRDEIVVERSEADKGLEPHPVPNTEAAIAAVKAEDERARLAYEQAVREQAAREHEDALAQAATIVEREVGQPVAHVDTGGVAVQNVVGGEPVAVQRQQVFDEAPDVLGPAPTAEPRLHQVADERTVVAPVASSSPSKLTRKARRDREREQKERVREEKDRAKALEREQKGREKEQREREKVAEKERRHQEKVDRERAKAESSPTKPGFLGGLKGFFGADLVGDSDSEGPARRERAGVRGVSSSGRVSEEATSYTEGAVTTWVPTGNAAMGTASSSAQTTPTKAVQRSKPQRSPSKGLSALFGRHDQSAPVIDDGSHSIQPSRLFNSALVGKDEAGRERQFVVMENPLDFSARSSSMPVAVVPQPTRSRVKGGMERRRVVSQSGGGREPPLAAGVIQSSGIAIAHAPAPLDLAQIQAEAEGERRAQAHQRSRSSTAALGGGRGWSTRTDKNLQRLAHGEGWGSDPESRGIVSLAGGGRDRFQPLYEPVVMRDEEVPLKGVEAVKRKQPSGKGARYGGGGSGQGFAQAGYTDVSTSSSMPVSGLERQNSTASGPARKLRKLNTNAPVRVSVPQVQPFPSSDEPRREGPGFQRGSTSAGYVSDSGGTLSRKKSTGTRRTTSMSGPSSQGVQNEYGATVLSAGGQQPSGRIAPGGWSVGLARNTSVSRVPPRPHPSMGHGLPPGTVRRANTHVTPPPVRKQKVDRAAPVPDGPYVSPGQVPRAPPSALVAAVQSESLLSIVESVAIRNRQAEEQMRILKGNGIMDLQVPQAPSRVPRSELEGPGSVFVTPPKVSSSSSSVPVRRPSTMRPAQMPLKSAMKDPSRTPSPLPANAGLPTQSLPRATSPLGARSHANGGKAPASLSSHENAATVAQSKPARDRSPPSGGHSSNPDADTPQRRKSVRVSLKPTFLSTPPAIEYEEPPVRESHYVHHPQASTSMPSTPTATSSRDLNGATAQKIKDIWENSSDEDEEYTRARSQLARATMEEKAAFSTPI